MSLFKVNNFWKEKKLWKVNLWYQWITQCNADSCYESTADGLDIYLYRCLCLLAPECDVSLYVCFVSNQSTSKKPHYVLDLSTLDALLHKTHLLVLRFQGSTSCGDAYHKNSLSNVSAASTYNLVPFEQYGRLKSPCNTFSMHFSSRN